MGEGDCRHGWKCSQQLGEVEHVMPKRRLPLSLLREPTTMNLEWVMAGTHCGG